MKQKPTRTAPAVNAKTEKVKTRKARPAANGHDRRAWIAEAAYYEAERRGFTPGQEMQDWVLAEQKIEQLLNC